MSTLDIIDKSCIAMNKDIRFLTRVCHNKLDSDETYRAQKTLNTAISADPTAVMKVVGPYLLKYAEPISEHDDKFFLAKDFKEDVEDKKDIDTAMKIITTVKSVYETCSEEEREKIKETASDMLSHYCEYKLAVAEVEKKIQHK